MKDKVLRLMAIIIITLIVIDQLSKFVIVKNFLGVTSNTEIGIEIVQNTGMAFGFNEGNTKNIILSIFVLAIVINFIKTQKDRIDTKTQIALSMILSGGMSNLIDRIFRGHIIDFIKVYEFPRFNLADSYVVIGWILLVVFLIIYSRKK